MKKLGLIGLSLTIAGGAYAVDDQAFLALLAETKVTRMAGMKKMNIKLPPGIKLKMPAGTMNMMSGEPTRSFNIRLWSPTIAPDNATAFIVPPAGLGQGDKLDLELYRPKPTETESGGVQGFAPDSNPDFTIKLYWGSSDTVKDGQPKVIHWGGMTPEQKEAVKAHARDAQRGGGTSYFYKPGWTTGYWPKDPIQIDAKASLVGNFALTSTYTGNVAIDSPQNVDFLAPIEMTAPNLEQKIDLGNSIDFQWTQVPNLLGQFATIMGMEGKNTLVLWTSSEIPKESAMADMGFLQMSEVKDLVGQTVFMPGDRTSVNVPVGIFKECDFAMFQMAGYGPGTALDQAQPLPRIQTKTTLSIMLGGKKMAGMGR